MATTQRAVKAKKAAANDSMAVTVASLMTRRAKTVRPDTSLEEAMNLMLAKDISHLPVVDEGGSLVGILSKTDVVRRIFLEGDTREVAESVRVQGRHGVSYSLGGGFHEDDLVTHTVSEVMSSRVRTVEDTATLAEAAIVMAKLRVHGLPVVAGGKGADKKKLVGFLSTFDIVGWVANN